MKLASYLLDGKPVFGALAGDGLVTLSGRLPTPCLSLREALAADLLHEIRQYIAKHTNVEASDVVLCVAPTSSMAVGVEVPTPTLPAEIEVFPLVVLQAPPPPLCATHDRVPAPSVAST